MVIKREVLHRQAMEIASDSRKDGRESKVKEVETSSDLQRDLITLNKADLQ